MTDVSIAVNESRQFAIYTEAYKGHTKNTPIHLSKSKNFVFRNLNISFLEIEKFCFSKSNNFVCQNLEISFFEI